MNKPRLGRILLPLLLLLLLPACALGATDFGFSFRCPDAGVQEAVVSRKSGSQYLVFLPGSWDPSRLEVAYEGEEILFLGEQEIPSGTMIDVSDRLGKAIPLKDKAGKKRGSVRFRQGSRLACVFVTVDGKELKAALKDKHRVISEGSILITEPDGSVAYEGALAQFKGRGNNTYSSQNGKKPFQFKLERKADISGMGKGKTWLLIASYVDLTLLRNQIALDLAREAGLRFAVKAVQADVWLNGAYNGLYLLTQKIQIQSSRVDIHNLEEETEELNDQPVSASTYFKETGKKTELRGYEIPVNPKDITGGYLIELEKPYRFRGHVRNGFKTSVDLYFAIKEPTYASRAQVTYIGDLFDKVFRAIRAKDGHDPQTGEYYADMIDLTSFATKLLVEDFTKNYDLLAGSQFFYKDRDDKDPKIYAGPCWDYDLSMGDMAAAGVRPEGAFALKVSLGKVNWYKMLYQHADFQQEVKRVYREQFRPALALLLGEREDANAVMTSLEEYEARISASTRMNFSRWDAEKVTGYYEFSGDTPSAARDFLFKWIRERVKYLDKFYGAAEE